MCRFRFLAAILAGLVAVGFQAGAADKDKAKAKFAELLKGGPAEFIKRFDKNGDGRLSKDEAPPKMAENFDKVDKNGDGQLDQNEVEQMIQILRKRFEEGKGNGKGKKKEESSNDSEVERSATRMLEQMDKNKDGKIGKDEAADRVAEFFDQIDANKDGFLDQEELRRAVAKVMASQGGRADSGAAAAGRRPDFDSLDRDADGRLLRDELKNTPFFERFDELDADRDGKITPKEFEAFVKKQEEKKTDKETPKK